MHNNFLYFYSLNFGIFLFFQYLITFFFPYSYTKGKTNQCTKCPGLPESKSTPQLQFHTERHSEIPLATNTPPFSNTAIHLP